MVYRSEDAPGGMMRVRADPPPSAHQRCTSVHGEGSYPVGTGISWSLFFLLLGPQRRVGARGGQERLVGAALGNFSVLDDQDLVGVDHGGQPVGDDQHRRPMGNLGQVFLDHAFGD